MDFDGSCTDSQINYEKINKKLCVKIAFQIAKLTFYMSGAVGKNLGWYR